MKVSVVIPVFNRIDTLKDAIESVFLQTFKDIEIIVIDDDSDINIKDYLTPYLNRIKYIKNKVNCGVSNARNLGIENATGEYIAFIDSDDLWLDFKIEYQLSAMVSKNYLVCHTDEFWYKNGKFVNQGKKHKKYGGKILMDILDICRISPSTVVIHKSVFKKTGKFNPFLIACEDYDLWLRIASFYEILFLEKKTAVKRSITDDQLSLNTPHMESMRLKSLANFLAKYKNYLVHNEIQQILSEIKKKEKIVKKGE
jgi:glycosyltransferase involved in cell wall biosynthesis